MKSITCPRLPRHRLLDRRSSSSIHSLLQKNRLLHRHRSIGHRSSSTGHHSPLGQFVTLDRWLSILVLLLLVLVLVLLVLILVVLVPVRATRRKVMVGMVTTPCCTDCIARSTWGNSGTSCTTHSTCSSWTCRDVFGFLPSILCPCNFFSCPSTAFLCCPSTPSPCYPSTAFPCCPSTAFLCCCRHSKKTKRKTTIG